MPEVTRQFNVEDLKEVSAHHSRFSQARDPLLRHYDPSKRQSRLHAAHRRTRGSWPSIARKIDLVLGIEAAPASSSGRLSLTVFNAGFVPVRKPRKLPAPVARVTYELGSTAQIRLEIHMDAITPGQSIVLVDDLLATGGTMEATVKLVKQLGGDIAGLAFAVELDFLKGRDRFKEYDVFSLLHYDE